MMINDHLPWLGGGGESSALILLFSLLPEPGRLMTKYYLKFGTMKYIMQAQSNCSLEDALHIVCRAEELSCMYFYVCDLILYGVVIYCAILK